MRLAALALALVAGACAGPRGPVLAVPAAADPQALTLYLPEAPGAHPGVVLVPACEAPLISTRAALFTRYAEKLKGEGFAVMVLSYPGGGRGDPSCQAEIAPKDLAARIAAALAQLRATPGVNPRRLHVAGWGWGARAVLEVVMAPSHPPGLVSAAAFYPFCPDAAAWRGPVTLQLFLAEHDRSAPPAACRAWADKSDGPGPVVVTRYVGVGHGFDANEVGEPRFAAYATGTPLVFDAPTAWQAGLDLVKFLRLKLPDA